MFADVHTQFFTTAICFCWNVMRSSENESIRYQIEVRYRARSATLPMLLVIYIELSRIERNTTV